MAEEDLKVLVSRIRHHPRRDCGTGATVDEIAAAEKELGVCFPGEYRQFLLAIGWGGIAHMRVIGLGQGVPRTLDLVNITRGEREDAEPSMRSELIPVVADGSGNHYCVLSGKGESVGCPVYFWAHDEPDGESQVTRIVGDDFFGWLSSRFDFYGL